MAAAGWAAAGRAALIELSRSTGAMRKGRSDGGEWPLRSPVECPSVKGTRLGRQGDGKAAQIRVFVCTAVIPW